MSLLMDEAILPALSRLSWEYMPLKEAPAVAVPLACDPPSAAVVLLTLEANDERREAVLYAQLSVVSPARRAAVALHLAELNTRFPFVTFSMSRDGEVRIDVWVELIGVPDEMTSVTVELGARRIAQALSETYRDLQRIAAARQRRPRLEREVVEVLRSLES